MKKTWNTPTFDVLDIQETACEPWQKPQFPQFPQFPPCPPKPQWPCFPWWMWWGCGNGSGNGSTGENNPPEELS